MFAPNLLRILQTFPTHENNEICDFDTDEVKETMKESPKRYTNPFLSDEENEKVNLWSNQEVYTDKNVTECELPELLVCYKEGGFHVKDICVDEGIGIPHGERILFNEDNHDILCISSSTPSNEDKHDDVINESLVFSPMEDFFKESNHHMNVGESNVDVLVEDLQNCMPDDAKEFETIMSIDPNELKNVSKDDDDDGVSEYAPEKLKDSAESDTVPEVVDSYAPEEEMDSSAVTLNDKDKPLPSLKFLLDSINGVHDKDQEQCQNCEEEILKGPLEGNEEEVGTSEENSGKTVITTNGVHEVQDLKSVDERGVGESSFSVAGPVSGLISYSGQIAFSGSISLRSDSSTTSTRSFAFPVLQTEWNSSPVRMAKADRRRLQKHRGWRNGLLCCRF